MDEESNTIRYRGQDYSSQAARIDTFLLTLEKHFGSPDYPDVRYSGKSRFGQVSFRIGERRFILSTVGSHFVGDVRLTESMVLSEIGSESRVLDTIRLSPDGRFEIDDSGKLFDPRIPEEARAVIDHILGGASLGF